MIQTLILLACVAGLVAVLLLGRRGQPAKRSSQSAGEIVIELKCDPQPALDAIKQVQNEMERTAAMADRIAASIPKALAQRAA